MVKVPEYAQNVQFRPAFRQDVDVRATPEAFGADIGRGMQGLGQGASNLGVAVSQVQALDDKMRAKEADNKFADWARNRMFGEGGFMTLEGRNAVDGRKQFEEEAEQKRKEFGSGLSAGAARDYQSASTARIQSIYQQSIVHTAQARKSWFNDASAARVETFANDALVSFDKPDLLTKNIAAGQAEIRERGAMMGWDADTLNKRESEFVSGVHKNVTLRIAQTDPLAAEKYMNERKGQITGAHMYELEHGLKTEIKQEKSKRAASDFFTQSSQAGNGSVFGMISGFEGFRSSTYWDVNHHRVGYGSDTITKEDGSVVTVQQGMTVTQADAARDLNRRIAQSQIGIARTVGEDKFNALSAPAKAAVTSVAYNYGTLPDTVANAIRTGGPAEIATAIRGLAGHNEGVNAGRRNKEADAVLGIDTTAGTNDAARDAQSFYVNLESYLAKITDPDVQDMTRKRINAMLETQHKASTERQRTAKATLWTYIDQGKTPDHVPMDVRQAAGMEAVSAAWNYLDTARRGRDVRTDDALAYDMRRYAASNPNDFANLDLNDYRDRLSRDTIKEFTTLQQSALTDQRKAREDGLSLTAAFSQATQQLEAVGITTDGKKGAVRDEANKRIAQFQNSLSSEMAEFKRANNGRNPTQVDVQAMVNKLLLPIVIKTPGRIFDSTDTSKRLFEAGSRADNAKVDVDVKYGDIPIDLRRGIARDLERELGRKPNENEVVQRYEDFILKR